MTLSVRFRGQLASLTAEERLLLLQRGGPETAEQVVSDVRGILERVRREGDAALFDLTWRFDRAQRTQLEVPRSVWKAALDRLDPSVRRSLERSARNLACVHAASMPGVVEVETEPGVRVGRRCEPLSAVGVYAPGGRAAYPSSVLMGVVPARVAGVEEIVVCSPPSPEGLPSDLVLAAAELGGATRVFAMGGAQAVAALAYGTASVPRVERIVGPGNAWVAEAKRQVGGTVGIDSPAGPSELLIVADAGADPSWLARELCAQAEHDPEASCVALVLGSADALVRVLESMRPRKAEVVAQALARSGAILEVSSLDEALAFASAYAAEHLLLAVAEPESVLPRLRNTGTVFYGQGASVAFGDYMTGANHVWPTAGSARAFSGLSTTDFLRFMTYQEVTPEAAARMSADVALLADAEGLPSHADAARAWSRPQSQREGGGT